MSPDKGVHLAIDVARRAEVPLVIAAKMREPDERRYYDAFVAPRLGEDVEFVGEIDRSQRSALLASATCLLNPLQWDEPFGLVAIEALAAGVPVVATPRGAMPEIVIDGTTGYLGDTIDELASAVTRAPMIDRKRCRQDMEERFSMARMALDHERFYRGVIASHRPLWSQQQ
jgi:glycosyltransferase involved in cell wall biosynthesis